MSAFHFGMISNIDFDLIPVTFIIPDLFTGSAGGDEASQGFYIFKRGLKLFING
jgi:hypothetical protein